jgi:hypothetical protein
LIGQVWIAVLLLGVVQSIVFIPLHMLSHRFSNRIEDFEDEHLGYSEPEESEKVMAAPEIPRITFNFGSQGTELRLARMIAQGLRCQTFVNDKGQNLCEVDMPMSAKSAHALCEVLAECGYSGMDIARMWPDLAVVAGLYSAELDAMNYKYDIVKNP